MADLGPRTYVVRQGDYLEQLAFNLGFDADTVWGHEKNAELRALRKDQHNILFPGDLLYIPSVNPPEDASLKGGTENNYSATIPARKVELLIHNEDGPLPNEPYTIEGLGAPIEGNTDGDAKISFDVPLTTREVRLLLANHGAFSLAVGNLDPITEITGVQMRLTSLGFYWGDMTGSLDEDTRSAIQRFQRAKGLEMTGDLSAETADAIEKSYGC